MEYTTGWMAGSGFSTLMTVLIGVFVVLAVWAIGRGLYVWNKNNHSPRQTGNARVVTKRMKVSGLCHSMSGNITDRHGFHSSASTRYFATFELEDGQRLEFSVNDSEYGMLAEGDQGQLSFQGTRYLGFDRT